MENKLIQFLEAILDDSETTVVYKEGMYKVGFHISNPSWKCQVVVFSDGENGYYFQFNNITKSPHPGNYNKTPTYRTENINEVFPLLRKIIKCTEIKENSDIPNSTLYVDLFHKILKKEPLPKPYTFKITDREIQLTAPHLDHFMYISKMDITHFHQKALSLVYPTASLALSIHNINKIGVASYMFIPKGLLPEYHLLKNEHNLKNSEFLIPKLDDWLLHIESISQGVSPNVNNLVNYINLNEQLKNHGSTKNKNKPKL